MVSIMTTFVAIVFGFMVYMGLPVVMMTAPVEIREKVGRFYYKLGARSLKQFTLVRRVLSGYDVVPIKVDDEQKLLKVTLSSSMVGEPNEYRFNDPDNRIMRLFNKPVTLAFERIPAALDAELSEWGHWVREKAQNEGLVDGDYVNDPENVEVDTYFEAQDDLRLIDPIDAFEVVPSDVNPENVKTAEKKTKQRFEKYGDGVGLKETLRVMIGFAVGMGGVVAVQYANTELIGSGGGGVEAPVVGNATLSVGVDPGVAMDIMGAMA